MAEVTVQQSIKVMVKSMSFDLSAETLYCNRWHSSPNFTFGDNQCLLRVFIKSLDGPVSLELCLGDSPPQPLRVTTNLSKAARLLPPQTVIIKCAGNHNIWRSNMLDVRELARNIYGAFTWCFSVVVSVIGDGMAYPEDKSVQTPAYCDANFEIQSLSQDLSKLLDEDSSADVELKCGDATFKAHGNLLSARSEVFRAMLASDMTEGKTGRVQIVDTEAGLFRQFLQYLYTGKLEEWNMDTATRLYELGDKYNVDALKRQCASFMADNLSHENACCVLSLADRHTDGDLKEIATAYILNQKIPLRDDIWSDFCDDHPVLANKVLNRFCKLYVKFE